jgi:tRNA-splicing endonuclease subunit Sen54
VRTPQATSSSSSDPKGKGKGKAKAVPTIQLLPEEALFLLERGSLQIWMRPGEGAAEWDDEIWGVPGAVEMSVADAFAAFLGKDGLTWERYQVRPPFFMSGHPSPLKAMSTS